MLGDVSAGKWGGFAEYTCAHEKRLILKPEAMSYEEAASIPQAAALAYQGLNYKHSSQPDQEALIIGAGGGVGTFAIQLAKDSGTIVTGVDNAAKQAKMLELGADFVIDYEKEDFTQNGKQYDLILATVAFDSIFNYKRSLKPGGSFIMIGGSSKRILQNMFLGPVISMFGKRRLTILPHKPNQGLEAILPAWKQKKLKPVIDQVFPLKDTANAFRYYHQGEFVGKIIVKI